MEKREENVQRLKGSLELTHIRTSMMIYSVAMLIGAGFSWLKNRELIDGGRISVMVFSLFWGIILMIYGIWLYRIFRKAEDYVFCKTTLIKLHRGKTKNSMCFLVMLDIPGEGKVAAKTSGIFQTYGWPGPLVEDYVNQTVEIAYNKSTKQIVVIG